MEKITVEKISDYKKGLFIMLKRYEYDLRELKKVENTDKSTKKRYKKDIKIIKSILKDGYASKYDLWEIVEVLEDYKYKLSNKGKEYGDTSLYTDDIRLVKNLLEDFEYIKGEV